MPRPTRGARTGLRDGEIRLTIVVTDDQSQVLHDWARANGRTLREVAMAMAERYIDEVVRPYAESGHKLRAKAGKEPPETYAEFYEEGPVDMLDTFDEYAR